MNFLPNNRISRAITSSVAGIGDVDAAQVDVSGFEGLVAIIGLGAIAANGGGTVKFQHRDATAGDGSAWADVAGASVAFGDADDDKVVALECHNIRMRYMRAVVTRAGGNVTLRAGTYIQTLPAKAAVTHGGETITKTVIT